MRRYLLAILMILCFLGISCSSHKNSNESKQRVSAISKSNDNEMFMTFFEKFMENEAFQSERVDYPIFVKGRLIRKSKKWEFISLFNKRSYMPILNYDTISYFDRDIVLNKVSLVVTDLKAKYSPAYKFVKKDDKWYLKSIEHLNYKNIEDREFVDFIKRYSREQAYQVSHTRFPVSELYVNPENSNEIICGKISRKSWTTLNLEDELQDLVLLSADGKSDRFRTIYYRGINNGILVKYTFEKIGKEWNLTKLEDYSI